MIPPGSTEAIALGCICPQIENHYGEGVCSFEGERLYWFTVGCPVHGNVDEEEE